MKFGNLSIHNFLSIKDAEINLSDRGLMLIEGVNQDDPSARSNGAGKSSIVDALSWCLYGKTARGVSGGDVVNKKAGKGCSVTLRINDSGTEYIVVRERKNASTGTLVLGKFVPAYVDLTKGTMAETQKAIEEIMGCPYEVFVATVYAGQEAMPDIPNMTDKQLKELIESVIGVEKLSDAYQKALDGSRTIENQYADEKRAYDSVCEKIDLLNRSLTEAETRSENYLKEMTAECEVATKDYNDYVVALKNAEDDLLKYKKGKEVAEVALEGVKKNLDVLEKINKKLEQKNNELNNMARDVWSAENEYQRAGRLLEESKREEANIESRIGTKCSECGKVYTQDDLKDASEQAHAKTLKIASDCDEMRSKYDSIKIDYDKAVAAFNKVKTSIPDARSLYAQQNDLMEKIRACESKESEVSMFSKEAERKRNAIEELQEKIKKGDNPYSSEIEHLKEQLQSLSEERDAKQKIVESLESGDLEVYKALKQVFGKEGVRQHVLDTVTPVLNDRTARYLNALSDGKLSAIWTTLSTTKKGEVKENFNIKVSNSVGGNSFASLSGGEKRKVRVACCLALQELVASRATKPIELFVADEVDHALDDAGVERLISVLNEKAYSCKTLLVISHNPLRNWIDNVIQVVKKDGYSTIQ